MNANRNVRHDRIFKLPTSFSRCKPKRQSVDRSNLCSFDILLLISCMNSATLNSGDDADDDDDDGVICIALSH